MPSEPWRPTSLPEAGETALEGVSPYCPRCLRYLVRPVEVTPENATEKLYRTCRSCGWKGWVRFYRKGRRG